MAINQQNLELICCRVNKIYFTLKIKPPKTKVVKNPPKKGTNYFSQVCVEGLYKQVVKKLAGKPFTYVSDHLLMVFSLLASHFSFACLREMCLYDTRVENLHSPTVYKFSVAYGSREYLPSKWVLKQVVWFGYFCFVFVVCGGF